MWPASADIATSSSGSLLNRSGGTLSSSGLSAWQTIVMSCSYWSKASASCFECRAISLTFSLRSCPNRT